MTGYLKRHRLLLYFLVLGITLWLCNFLFFGFSLDNFFAKVRLATAKANWEAAAVEDYHMTIDVNIPLSRYPIGRISMTVKNKEVIAAEIKDLFDLRDRNYDPDNVPYQTIDPEQVAFYTMDNLFTSASQYIDHAIGRIELEFSPSPSNYFVRFSEDCSPPPLIGRAIGDCGFYYEVIEFEPLES